MTIGRAKFLFERYRSNLAMVSFALVLRVNIVTSPISWWWYVAGIIFSLIYLYVDVKYIFPKEMAAGTLKNPEWIRLINAVEDIQRRIK